MCFGKGPKAPDPAQTARDQNTINLEAMRQAAKLNQIGEEGPFGKRYYTGSNEDGTRVEHTELSPEQLALYKKQTEISQGLSDKAFQRLGQIPEGPFSLEGMPDVRRAQSVNYQKSLPTTSAFSNYDYAAQSGPKAFGEFGLAKRSIEDAGDIQRGFADVGSQQRSIDTGGLQQISGLNDFGSERNRVEDALYQRGSRRVNQQYNRDERALQARLAAQGITQGSAAYNDELTRLNQNRDDALATATEGSIINAGGEQGRLFGQSLAARQQGVGEKLSMADLYNQGQGTDYSQDIGRAGFANQAQQQQYLQNAQDAQFYNQGQQQDISNDLSRVGSDRAYQQWLGDQQDDRVNANRAQDMQRVLSDREWNMQNAEFGNNALARQFSTGLDLQNADQSYRDSRINENVLQRNQGFNELAAFLNGSPIQPTGQTFQNRAQYNPAQASPDSVGTANSNYQAAAQARAAKFGAIAGAVGKIGGGFAAACWVAREVYGANNPRWVAFRTWLETKAPKWFARLYIQYGARFAGWISDKPRIKGVIRRWMDARIL